MAVRLLWTPLKLLEHRQCPGLISYAGQNARITEVAENGWLVGSIHDEPDFR
jgi:hypothetical protein